MITKEKLRHNLTMIAMNAARLCFEDRISEETGLYIQELVNRELRVM